MVPSGAKAMSSAMPSGVGNRNLRRAIGAIDLVKRGARDAAGEQPPGLVDAEPVHAMESRTGNELGDLIGLRRSADGAQDGGGENDRSNSRTACKPARHDATSR